MRPLPLLALALGAGIAVQVQAADPTVAATDWLQRLDQAEQRQNYQGTFVYERSGNFSTHDIWHKVQGGRITERLLQLDGPAQEVVRVNGRTQCVSGTMITGVGMAPNAAGWSLDPLKLMSWYDLKVSGESRVADRPAVIITLTPRDQDRYAFELHLDKATGLPLKSLLLNERGHLLERFQFTRLEQTVPSDAELTPSAGCQSVAQMSRKKPENASVWRSDWLPPGFELISSNTYSDPEDSAQVSSQMYDDGLARFSVFLEPLGRGDALDIRTQLGPTSAVSRKVTTPRGVVLVTVVGEIPIGTAERIALSMRAPNAQAAR